VDSHLLVLVSLAEKKPTRFATMLDRLPDDVIILIGTMLPMAEVDRLLTLTNAMQSIDADTVYDAIAQWRWGHEFWQRAAARTCRPRARSMRCELLAIERFQCSLQRHLNHQWCHEDFYRYWDAQDKYNEEARRGVPPKK
jgi:hypothetical protein